MSVYIYSVPKAGTYFFAELLEQLGLENTGFHINKDSYLDSKAFSLEANARTPSRTEVKKFFVPVIRKMKKDQFAFGHFPIPLNPHVATEHMKFLCTYRHPRKTLVSEFIDFRHRRSDVPWLSKKETPDDAEAFCKYLQRHGVGPHLTIVRNMVLLHHVLEHKLGDPALRRKSLFVNFEDALKSPAEVSRIAEFLDLPLKPAAAKALHGDVLGAETKTKATNLSIDRDALWTKEAEEIYANSLFPKAVEIGRLEGLHF